MEIIEREMNGNVLLAIEAMSNDWQCIIGTKKSIFDNAQDLPPGLVFLKSVTFKELANLKKLKSYGHKLVCLDVEGLVYTSMEEFVSVRFCEETLAEIEGLYFWGDIPKDAVAKTYPDEAHKFMTTGSPIAELWQNPDLHAFYDDDVQALQGRFGKFIIIPSSFGTVNHYMGYEATLGIMKRDQMLHEDEEEEFLKFWSDYEAHVMKIFQAFLKMIPNLSKAFPDHKILIRPHPSESHETWKLAAKDMDNVEVLFEGTVSPWLLAADAVLHWGCTTGLEAFVMGKHVVAYNPSTEEERQIYDHKLPQSISVVTDTEEETFEALKRIIDSPDTIEDNYPDVKAGREGLKKWLRSSEQGASAELFQAFKRMDIQPGAVQPLKYTKIPFKERIWVALAFLGRSKLINRMYNERILLGIESRAYGKHKTRDIKQSVLEEVLIKLSDIRGVSGTRVEEINRNLFLLSRKE